MHSILMSNVLKITIDLIKSTADLSNNLNVNIEKLIKCLSEPCYGK